jgi:hypothetical protein
VNNLPRPVAFNLPFNSRKERKPACRVVEFASGPHHREDHPTRFSCVTSEEWPDLYYGVFDADVGPVGRHGERSEMEFRFPSEIGEVERVFLLCKYQLDPCANTTVKRKTGAEWIQLRP